MITKLVNKLALGTVQFGLNYGISNHSGKTPIEEVCRILDYASEIGIDTLDTAQEYGSSEEVLGHFHEDRFKIVTKVKLHQKGHDIVKLLKKSLDHLNTKHLYAVMFHNEKSALENPKAIEDLLRLKENGIVDKIGLSVCETPDKLEVYIREFGIPDILQIPYNHLDTRFKDLATKLRLEGVEIHTRSTFLQGLFFMSPENLSNHFDPVKNYIHNLNEQYQSNSEKAAGLLAHVLTQPFINKVVIGINSVDQLKDNLSSISMVSPIEIQPPADIDNNILMPNLWSIN